jgi:hypothetical protein
MSGAVRGDLLKQLRDEANLYRGMASKSAIETERKFLLAMAADCEKTIVRLGQFPSPPAGRLGIPRRQLC